MIFLEHKHASFFFVCLFCRNSIYHSALTLDYELQQLQANSQQMNVTTQC